MTQRLQACADVWRDTAGMSDEQLADLARAGGIDILVDLTMHMEGSRLLTFARKPAPVQITYLAYCSTTGLSAMDYRLSDPWLDPPAHTDDAHYTEKTLRLGTYWCYQAPPEAPAVVPPPSQSTGHITFGCLNTFSKVTAGIGHLGPDRFRGSKIRAHTSHGRRLPPTAGPRPICGAARRSRANRIRHPNVRSGLFRPIQPHRHCPRFPSPTPAAQLRAMPCGWACPSSPFRAKPPSQARVNDILCTINLDLIAQFRPINTSPSLSSWRRTPHADPISEQIFATECNPRLSWTPPRSPAISNPSFAKPGNPGARQMTNDK